MAQLSSSSLEHTLSATSGMALPESVQGIRLQQGFSPTDLSYGPLSFAV